MADPKVTAALIERQRQALRDMGDKALCPHEYRPAVRTMFQESPPGKPLADELAARREMARSWKLLTGR